MILSQFLVFLIWMVILPSTKSSLNNLRKVYNVQSILLEQSYSIWAKYEIDQYQNFHLYLYQSRASQPTLAPPCPIALKLLISIFPYIQNIINQYIQLTLYMRIFASKVLQRSMILSQNMYGFGENIVAKRREKQSELAQKIRKGLQASFVSVTDTTFGSNSCGEMYNIVVQSPLFESKNKLEQQRMVNQVLSEEIKKIHGYSLKTKITKKVVNTPQKNGQVQAKQQREQPKSEIDMKSSKQ